MKRVSSLFLLFVFLFGLIGYYGAFWVLSEKAHLELNKRLDENRYDEEETVTIKFPLNLAYPINATQYERVDGSFEYQGEFYKLVKQKLENDTLYVVYIKDQEKKHLQTFFADITKASHDQPVNSSAFKLICSYSNDFESTLSLRINPRLFLLSSFNNSATDENPIPNSYPVLTPPPEV
ncbi:MAG TPA: hypothetical protein VFW11_19725 [Cyclobacteriaceae bacterium]|nr:hypothetical protein [Cyclobacteriaceae bacterium]